MDPWSASACVLRPRPRRLRQTRRPVGSARRQVAHDAHARSVPHRSGGRSLRTRVSNSRASSAGTASPLQAIAYLTLSQLRRCAQSESGPVQPSSVGPACQYAVHELDRFRGDCADSGAGQPEEAHKATGHRCIFARSHLRCMGGGSVRGGVCRAAPKYRGEYALADGGLALTVLLFGGPDTALAANTASQLE